MKGAIRPLLVTSVTLILAGCGAYGMPRTTPLQGQSAAAMARDRYDCDGVAKSEAPGHAVRHPTQTTVGPIPPTRVPAQERDLARQRDAAFSECMKKRGYDVP